MIVGRVIAATRAQAGLSVARFAHSLAQAGRARERFLVSFVVVLLLW